MLYLLLLSVASASISNVSFLGQMSKSEDIDAYVPEEFSDDTDLVEAVQDVDEMATDLLGTGEYDNDNFPTAMDELDDVQEYLDDDEYVIFDNEEYTDEKIEETQDLAEFLHEDKIEELSKTGKMVAESIENLEEALLDEEEPDEDDLAEELDAWIDLLESVDTDDVVVILEEEFTYEEIEAEIAEVEAELTALAAEDEEALE